MTDINATRYFWTIDEALNLIEDCLENASNSNPYCPDMKSIKIGDLMEAMQLKYGKASSIKEIGLQQGENLHEKILENGRSSDEVEQYTIDEINTMI